MAVFKGLKAKVLAFSSAFDQSEHLQIDESKYSNDAIQFNDSK